jgi:hypothetical protein
MLYLHDNYGKLLRGYMFFRDVCFHGQFVFFLGVQRRRKVALKHNCESEEAIKAGPKLCITKFLYKEYSKDLCLCWKAKV